MKNNAALVAAIALGVLGFAAMRTVLRRPDAREADRDVTRIVVAQRDLAPGTKMDATCLDVREVPTTYCSAHHVEESQKGTLLGRELRARVRQGEPILSLAFETGGAQASVDLESRLTYPDTHALSFAVDMPAFVAGLIKPDQKVDVLGTFDVHPSARSVLMLQNRTVLAVRPVAGADERWAVVIAVTPEEMVKVALLYAKGRPHVALRKRSDPTTVHPAPAGIELIIPKAER